MFLIMNTNNATRRRFRSAIPPEASYTAYYTSPTREVAARDITRKPLALVSNCSQCQSDTCVSRGVILNIESYSRQGVCSRG
jgi:hypothetical protein